MSTQDNDIKMDSNTLYREEVFTDRKMGTVRVMTPVTDDGATDIERPVVYTGQTQIMTPMGTLPIAFEIEANSLSEAVAKFGEGAKQAIEQTMEEIKELRRQAASQIVIPEAGGGGFGGGVPGGGKIQL
ncbi:MAG: hypothetical protein GC149_10705 [Gammaproteobacteria bacterium]|nr:hypothetical protein [Gammaproteobacteria bacterium]